MWDVRSGSECGLRGTARHGGGMGGDSFRLLSRDASCRGLSKTAVEVSSTTDLARYNTDDNEEDAVTSMANEMDL